MFFSKQGKYHCLKLTIDVINGTKEQYYSSDGTIIVLIMKKRNVGSIPANVVYLQ